MLVLTRKTDESIVIDGRITITVLRLRGNRIRLGIDAPENVSVRRAELPPLNEFDAAGGEHPRDAASGREADRNVQTSVAPSHTVSPTSESILEVDLDSADLESLSLAFQAAAK